MLVYRGGTPTLRLHTGLCKFVQNISTNMWGVGKRTDLKSWVVSSLLISYNITISWLYPLDGFRIISLYYISQLVREQWLVNLAGRTLLYSPIKSKVGFVAKLFRDLSMNVLNFYSK